jgi:hypothetical protein
MRRQYEANLAAFIGALRSGARARKIDYMPIHTGMPYDGVLRRCLAARRTGA